MEITTPLRDFRANISHCILRMKAGDVFVVNGARIGLCERLSEAKPCPHGREPLDGWRHCPHCLGLNAKDENVLKIIPEEPPLEIAQECKRCHKKRECREYEEDGEKYPVCQLCVRTVQGNRWKKVWALMKPCL